MPKAYQKSVVVILTVLIALGSVSNAVAAAISCLPKACCCTPKPPEMMTHQGQMEMETPKKCTPKTPAPCCQVEPFHPIAEVAISSQPTLVPQRMKWVHLIAEYSAQKPEQRDLSVFKSVLATGPLLKIPLVPIYLQTLTILC